MIGIIAALIVGPQRLPAYAQKLAELVKAVRNFADTAKTRVKDEIGDDVDWQQLDPRQYDPRRIIRDALVAPASSTPEAPVMQVTPPRVRAPAPSIPLETGEPAPLQKQPNQQHARDHVASYDAPTIGRAAQHSLPAPLRSCLPQHRSATLSGPAKSSAASAPPPPTPQAQPAHSRDCCRLG